MTVHRLRLPRLYVEDRLDRGEDCGTVEFKGTFAVVECSTRVLGDLVRDAAYQAEYPTSYPAAIRSACSATLRLQDYVDGLVVPGRLDGAGGPAMRSEALQEPHGHCAACQALVEADYEPQLAGWCCLACGEFVSPVQPA